MFLLKWLVLFVKPLVSRFPRLSAIYRGMRDQLEEMAEPLPTPWGFMFAGNISMAKGTFEPVETELVRRLLQEVDTLVNVGANVGYYCCHALSMGKPIIAFEPMPRNLRILCNNINCNGWDGAEIFPIALSNKVSILEIYGANTGASLVKGWAGISENYKTLVPCSTMDILLNNRLDGKKALVLVDIEGAEKWMLEGAQLMLDNVPSPIWVMEITSKELQPNGGTMNPNFKSTFELFFKHGYEAFDIEENMRPMTKILINQIFNGEIDFNSNNFMFRKLQ